MHISKRQDGADECECMANMRLENASELKKECKIVLVINDVRNINKIIKSISRQRKTCFFSTCSYCKGIPSLLRTRFSGSFVFFSIFASIIFRLFRLNGIACATSQMIFSISRSLEMIEESSMKI